MSLIAIDARIISSTTGRYVERLLHHLEKIDTTNNYVVLVRKKDEGYWKPSNVNFKVMVADFDNYSFNEQLGYLHFLNSLNADLVHFCQPEQPIFYTRNKVTTIHDLTLLKTYNSDKNWFIYHFKQFIGEFVFKSVAKRSHTIITPTDFTKNEIMERFGTSSNKIVRTYEAAEAKIVEQKPYKLPTEKFILFVGQQSDYKNVVRLAEAHQKLLTAHPDLHLVLVGKIDSPAQKNQKLFKKRNYKNITFTGFAEDNELNWLYAHCSAYVFPSLMEGFGLPGLEAMLQGAPVLSSDATCLPEVYGNGALYFDPMNTEEIANSIGMVLSDTKLRTKLIAAGRKQVEKYSWEKMAKQTLDVYKKALNQNT